MSDKRKKPAAAGTFTRRETLVASAAVGVTMLMPRALSAAINGPRVGVGFHW